MTCVKSEPDRYNQLKKIYTAIIKSEQACTEKQLIIDTLQS